MGFLHPAAADEVTSKGTALRGTIESFSSAGVQIAPEYGKGTLSIKWEDVEEIEAEGPFQILHGDDEEDVAPLQGLRDGKLLVGESAATATPVDVTTIFLGTPIGDGGLSFGDRMRSRWRYWDGSFDLGFNLTQSTVDTTGLQAGLNATRRKDRTRFILATGYRYGTQKQRGKERSTLQDQWRGLLRGEYDITPRIYGFASGDALYDAIQRLSIRGVSKLGLGYLIWEEKLDATRRNFLQAEAGGAWIYEKFFGGADNDFYAVAFGALAGYHLPYGSKFDWRLDYLPAVDDWANDYLLRTEAGLTVPMFDPISMKAALTDEYDSKPAKDSDRNSLFLSLGFSLLF